MRVVNIGKYRIKVTKKRRWMGMLPIFLILMLIPLGVSDIDRDSGHSMVTVNIDKFDSGSWKNVATERGIITDAGYEFIKRQMFDGNAVKGSAVKWILISNYSGDVNRSWVKIPNEVDRKEVKCESIGDGVWGYSGTWNMDEVRLVGLGVDGGDLFSIADIGDYGGVVRISWVVDVRQWQEK